MPYICSASSATICGVMNRNITALIVKTLPVGIKDGTDTEVYLYCNEANPELLRIVHPSYLPNCGRIQYLLSQVNGNAYNKVNGLVPCKFKAEKVEPIDFYGNAYVARFGQTEPVAKASGLGYKQLHALLKGEPGYALSFTSLSIFDRPMGLGEFYRPAFKDCGNCAEKPCTELVLTRAPRGFQRVEVGK